MADTNAAFAALADPTRRAVFERLASGPRSVGELAQGLPVSRPAVSQHLKVLREAGLVDDRADGTRRVYSIDPAGLGVVRAWLDRFWSVALKAFVDHVEAAAPGNEPGATGAGRRGRKEQASSRLRRPSCSGRG
jgi:DNA-binding transcriptional ArsR family regulator